MKHFVLCILIILFLDSCHHSKKENSVSVILNVDNFERDKDFAFDSIVFIPLETNDSSLVYGVDKIIHRNQFYYIHDRELSCIFIYSEKGTFVNCLNRKGQGPSEYLDITDFDVDLDNNIYIGCAGSRKVIKYMHPNYKESEEYAIDVPFLEIAVDYNTNQIWLANILDEEAGCKPLAFFSNGEITTILATRDVFDDIEQSFKRHSFSRSGSNLYFNPRYSSCVYELKEGDAVPFMEIKSARFISKEDLIFDREDTDLLRDFFKKKLIDGFYFFYKYADKYIGMIRNAGFMIYDSTNQKGNWIKPLPHNPEVFAQDKDYFFTAIAADVFKEYYPEHAINVSDEDNPIIVKMKI